MKTWQVLFLVLAASFLGLMLYSVSPPKTPQDIPNRINPVQTLINRVAEPKETKILLTGDVMLGRSVMTKSIKLNDYKYPFLKVADRLVGYDLVFANLENPVVKDCPKSDSGFKFCAGPKMLEGLVYSGIDVVNIANNHTQNYGKDGFEQTKKYLDSVAISYVGDRNLVIKEKDGTRFGFLGFDYVDGGPANGDLELISSSKPQVDILIVAIHWGTEYKDKSSVFQKSVAPQIIKAGADIIAGTHPHWVQTVEEVEGKQVFYSLGNFVFDQMWSEETRKGVLAELVYDGPTLKSQKLLNIYMKDFAQPEFVEN